LAGAARETQLEVFPAVLLVRCARFALDEQMRPVKLDTGISVDTALDLTQFASKAPAVFPGAEMLAGMGFPEPTASAALRATGGNLQGAIDLLLSGGVLEAAAAPGGTGGQYRLVACITHRGKSTHSGHYVAHVLLPSLSGLRTTPEAADEVCGARGEQWVCLNDERAALSREPPLRHAYLCVTHLPLLRLLRDSSPSVVAAISHSLVIACGGPGPF
jgi:hypothetical protein